MTDRILAYLFEELSIDERREIEQRLQEDPVWRREYERLSSCLSGDDVAFERDLDDKSGTDLVRRTCCFVQQFAGETTNGGQALAKPCTWHAETDSVLGTAPGRWRLADLALAGGALFLVASLGVPALNHYRDHARRVECQENLRFLGTVLYDYRDRHKRFPHIRLGEHAGLYAAALAQEGGVDPQQIALRVVCPSSCLADDVAAGRVRIRIQPLAQFARVTPSLNLPAMLNMGGSFAFRVGYRDAHGAYRPLPFDEPTHEPLLADSPCSRSPDFRSANHGGCGQNVLYADVSVKFVADGPLADGRMADGRLSEETSAAGCKSEMPGRGSSEPLAAPIIDNLFVNYAGQPAAGWGPDDVVLLPSDYGPAGRMTTVGLIFPLQTSFGKAAGAK